MKLFRNENKVSLPLSVKCIEESPTLRTVRFQGPLGFPQVEEIAGWIVRYRERKEFRFKGLLLDFNDVPYADSSAVAQLVRTMFDYKNAGYEVGLIHLRLELENILEISRINDRIHSYATEAEAIASLA